MKGKIAKTEGKVDGGLTQVCTNHILATMLTSCGATFIDETTCLIAAAAVDELFIQVYEPPLPATPTPTITVTATHTRLPNVTATPTASRRGNPFDCAAWSGNAGSLAFPLHGLETAIPLSGTQDKANVVRLQD